MNAIHEPGGTRRRSRIAVVTETYPPEINGVARTVGLMVDALCARGHELQLVRPRQKPETAALNGAPRLRLVTGIPIPRYSNLQLGFLSRASFLREWRDWRPDLVHVVTEGPLGWNAAAAARELDIPVSSDFHTNFHSYSRHYGLGVFAGLVARYLRALHNRADRTLVPTAQMKAELEALAFERVLVVGRGVDAQLFHPGRRNAELRAAWGCRGNETVVLHVGRLAPEKNLELFAQAAAAMRAEDPQIRVVLVGDGPQSPVLRARHPEFVFAGMRSGEDLAAHYASADVFLFPSTTETFGNVTLEAMASGLAIAAYDYAAAQQHLRHRVSALLAPTGDADEFLRMAAALARDCELRANLRRESRLAAEAITWERAFDELERALSDTIESRRNGEARVPRESAHVET